MGDARVAAELVGLVRELRGAGLAVGIEQAEAFAHAIELVDPLSRREIYLAARSTLVTRHEDLAPFDAVFSARWGGRLVASAQKVPLAPRHDPGAAPRTALLAYMAQRAGATDPEVEVPERAKAASALERLQRTDFAALGDDEREAIERALRGVRFDVTLRQTRRRSPSRRGDQIDLRRSLRAFARHGAVLTVPRRSRKWKQRPLVVLADISGSMELYARLLLQFLHGLTQGARQVETFAFGTRLTRITPALRQRSIDMALREAAVAIVDFGGGTRIGESLRAFNREHAPRVLRRGAVVLVLSDGWETGDVAQLARELERTKARCHRLVWVNPLLGQAGYEPRAAGMAAALAHVDDFLPVHDLQSLRQLAAHLARLPARKGRPLRAHPPPRGGPP